MFLSSFSFPLLCSPFTPPSSSPPPPSLLPSSLCPTLQPSPPSTSLTRSGSGGGTWSAHAAAALHPTFTQLRPCPALPLPLLPLEFVCFPCSSLLRLLYLVSSNACLWLSLGFKPQSLFLGALQFLFTPTHQFLVPLPSSPSPPISAHHQVTWHQEKTTATEAAKQSSRSAAAVAAAEAAKAAAVAAGTYGNLIPSPFSLPSISPLQAEDGAMEHRSKGGIVESTLSLTSSSLPFPPSHSPPPLSSLPFPPLPAAPCLDHRGVPPSPNPPLSSSQQPHHHGALHGSVRYSWGACFPLYPPSVTSLCFPTSSVTCLSVFLALSSLRFPPSLSSLRHLSLCFPPSVTFLSVFLSLYPVSVTSLSVSLLLSRLSLFTSLCILPLPPLFLFLPLYPPSVTSLSVFLPPIFYPKPLSLFPTTVYPPCRRSLVFLPVYPPSITSLSFRTYVSSLCQSLSVFLPLHPPPVPSLCFPPSASSSCPISLFSSLCILLLSHLSVFLPLYSPSASSGKLGIRQRNREMNRETGKPGNWETGKETGKPGNRERNRETGKPGKKPGNGEETGKPGNWEIGKPGNRETGKGTEKEAGKLGKEPGKKPGNWDYLPSLPSLSTFPLYLPSLPSLSTFPLYLPSLPSLSTFPLYLPSIPTLSTFPLYLPSQPSLYTYPLMFGGT
ncbi:unnamed protein product [Closterium sp. NIES-54]